MKRRKRRLGPKELQRLAVLFVVLAGLLGGLGGFLTAQPDPSLSRAEGSLIRIAAFAMAIAGALLLLRVVDILLLFDEAAARRRSLMALIIGLVAQLLGCLALSLHDNGSPSRFAAGLTEWLLLTGIGAALGGFISVLWVFGGTKAGEKMERMNDEDW